MIGSKIPWMPPFTENVEADFRIDGASICAAGTITNRVAGVVHARHGGLVRAGVQIKVGERTNLRVKWPIEDERFFLDGQHVVATIPAEAVRLESGMFRRSKQRWNRWIGRIVLVASGKTEAVYTVKIHGAGWTLKSYGPVLGARQPSKTWDHVNVVVDPQKIDLTIAEMRPWQLEGDFLWQIMNIGRTCA